MPFPSCTQTEDETSPPRGHSGLIRVTHDTRIEQRSRFEGVFVHEVRANEATLILRERRVGSQGIFHLNGTRLEDLQQVAVTTEEILEYLGKLAGDRRRVQRQYAFDNVVRARLVCRIQVARFGCRPEWPHEDPSRVGTQMQCMSVEERAV